MKSSRFCKISASISEVLKLPVDEPVICSGQDKVPTKMSSIWTSSVFYLKCIKVGRAKVRESRRLDFIRKKSRVLDSLRIEMSPLSIGLEEMVRSMLQLFTYCVGPIDISFGQDIWVSESSPSFYHYTALVERCLWKWCRYVCSDKLLRARSRQDRYRSKRKVLFSTSFDYGNLQD